MYAITGITGKVGGTVARHLLGAGLPVRAVVRDLEKGKIWTDKGCEATVATITDAHALTEAFTGVDAVFLMVPPLYDPKPGASSIYEFPEMLEMLGTIRIAIETARPGKVVFLSTVGGHVEEPNLLSGLHILEEGLRTLSVPITILRAAWFMENSAWDVEQARNGLLPSFLQPLDHRIPMVSTSDIGRVAADLLQETWSGLRIVELEGPRRYSADDIAAGFSSELGQPVKIEAVPREKWEEIFRSQGMQNPLPRIRMIDGFNEGWIDFEGGTAELRRGDTPLEAVIRELVRG